MKQVYVVTGGKGSGKSTALATFAEVAETEKVLAFDTEDSMSDIASQIPLKWVRMYERIRPDEDILDRIMRGDPPWVDDSQRSQWAGYFDYFIKRLNVETVEGKYKYLLLDTIEPIEAAMTALIERDGKSKFGWSGSPAYGRKETEGVRPLYEWLLEAVARRGIEHILISSHVKPVWMDKKPVPGMVKPGGRLAVLSKHSSLMLWLVHEPANADGAPAAIVLKARRGRYTQENGRWEPRRMLPQRIPNFKWRHVDGYNESPADFANPGPGEVMTDSERKMVSEFLTDAQMRLMVLGAEESAAQAKSRVVERAPVPAVTTPVDVNGALAESLSKPEKAKAMEEDGVPVSLIAEALEVPVPVVRGWLK